jgi:hypothetical protein
VLRRTALLFQDWLPAQSGKLNAYRLHCFSDPAAPFRRPCGLSRFSPDGSTVKCPIRRSRRVAPSIRRHSERNLAGSAEACAAPLMDFGSLQHIRRRRSTVRGFWLPAEFRLQGLITLLTVFALRCLAGFVSCRRRSWDSPFEAFSTREVGLRFRSAEPTCRLPADRCCRRGARSSAAVPRLLGFDPLERTWRVAKD